MQLVQTQISRRNPAETALAPLQALQPDLVLAFGDVRHFSAAPWLAMLQAQCPKAQLLGCSTAGEITAQGVGEGELVLTGLKFSGTGLRAAAALLPEMAGSHAAGLEIGQQLAPDLDGAPLRAVLVFGPGVDINGSALVAGISAALAALHPGSVIPLTGGLAGDGGAFRQTFTLGAQGIGERQVAAVGLYGAALHLAHGSFGGWETFGPARKVTRCSNNVLYELDGEPALGVYKRYLGDYARDLPASGLLFPFAMLGENHDHIGLIRTILGIDEASGSLTLAGDIDPDGYLKLMHASTDRLVGGAEAAAEAAQQMLAATGDLSGQPALAILVSCVGRKLVMGDRVDEEVEAVADVFGADCQLTGFYSYGEISPFVPGGDCRLHNQTMTITYLGEA
ncbi:MAG: hypothetical protein RIR00_1672 [Pseudomonadota bacterium]|jgi:hypothetical protein